MSAPELSPKEKRQLKRLKKSITVLSRKPRLAETYKFILRQQLRILFTMLGDRDPDKRRQAAALDVLKDRWPFKIRRLRKLINDG